MALERFQKRRAAEISAAKRIGGLAVARSRRVPSIVQPDPVKPARRRLAETREEIRVAVTPLFGIWSDLSISRVYDVPESLVASWRNTAGLGYIHLGSWS